MSADLHQLARLQVYTLTHLHGLPSHQTDATPTCGLFFMDSRSGTPAAYSMAYPTSAPRTLQWVQGRSNLSAREVMILGDDRRVSIQDRFAICSDCIVWKMWKVEILRLLWQLRLRIRRIHLKVYSFRLLGNSLKKSCCTVWE